MPAESAGDAGRPRGLVVRVRSRAFTVRVDGRDLPAVVPKKLRYREPGVVDPVAVGDRVLVSFARGRAVIEEVLPRRNALARPASGRRGKRQVLAANLDVALVVLAAADPPFKLTTLDRTLVLASAGGVPAAVCLNKVDLDPAVARTPELQVYPGIGLPLFLASALTGEGMEELRAFLAGKTAVLLGPSGVGKSSLINRMVPGADLRVGEVSRRTHKGRHITTWVEALDMPGGGRIIDSPGLRLLDLSELAPADLARHFPEIQALAGKCRFQDCRHRSEPDCAVKEAVSRGEVAPHRYRSYLRIYESLEAGEG